MEFKSPVFRSTKPLSVLVCHKIIADARFLFLLHVNPACAHDLQRLPGRSRV